MKTAFALKTQAISGVFAGFSLLSIEGFAVSMPQRETAQNYMYSNRGLRF
jgi:hypothetical protein